MAGLCVNRIRLTLLCSLVSACSPQLRMLKESTKELIPDYQWTATAPDGLQITVHTVLVRNGAGSWTRDADWDEYIVTFKNAATSAVRIETLRLESPYLPVPQQSSLSLKQLEDRTNDSLRTARGVASVAGGAAIIAGATAVAGAASTDALVPFAAAPVAAAPLVGMFVEYPLDRAIENHHLEHEDRSMIALTILERGAHLALDVPPGQQVLRSAFFPLTPGPSRLMVGYRIADEPRELAVPLPALAQLHLKSGIAAP
jgi:hypothetical protein